MNKFGTVYDAYFSVYRGCFATSGLDNTTGLVMEYSNPLMSINFCAEICMGLPADNVTNFIGLEVIHNSS